MRVSDGIQADLDAYLLEPSALNVGVALAFQRRDVSPLRLLLHPPILPSFEVDRMRWLLKLMGTEAVVREPDEQTCILICSRGTAAYTAGARVEFKLKRYLDQRKPCPLAIGRYPALPSWL